MHKSFNFFIRSDPFWSYNYFSRSSANDANSLLLKGGPLSDFSTSETPKSENILSSLGITVAAEVSSVVISNQNHVLLVRKVSTALLELVSSVGVLSCTQGADQTCAARLLVWKVSTALLEVVTSVGVLSCTQGC